MNHFVGLILLSLCISAVFSWVNPEVTRHRVRYFFKLLAYMVGGSFLFAWLMNLLIG